MLHPRSAARFVFRTKVLPLCFEPPLGCSDRPRRNRETAQDPDTRRQTYRNGVQVGALFFFAPVEVVLFAFDFSPLRACFFSNVGCWLPAVSFFAVENKTSNKQGRNTSHSYKVFEYALKAANVLEDADWALQLGEAAIEGDKGSVGLQLAVAEVLLKAGRLEEARAVLEVKRGEVYQSLEREGAIQCYVEHEEAVEWDR